jgi:hypothetical protein
VVDLAHNVVDQTKGDPVTETQGRTQIGPMGLEPAFAAPQPPSALGTALLDPPPATAVSSRLALEPAYLLTMDATGEVALPGLGVQVDDIGLSVVKHDGTLVAVLPWDDLSSLSAAGRTVTPDGTPAVVVEAATGLRTHRFVVPSHDPAALEAAVIEFGQAHGDTERRGRISPLLGVLFAVLAAVVVVLVLAATGVIKL